MLKIFHSLIEDPEDLSFFKKWMMIGLFVHLICAYFSTGFFHFDEQWQVLEFLGAKIGKTTYDVLPWEYRFQMRSWTQPFIYYLLFKPLLFFGFDNPFVLAMTARIFSSLIGWLSVIILSLSVFVLFDKKIERRWAIILLNTAYFIPFIHARPSSEAFASTFFCIGLGLLIILNAKNQLRGNSSNRWLFLIGFTLGLSFTFRFQMGFAVLFLWIWYAVWGNGGWVNKITLALGIILAVILELPIDRWGYGKWTIAAWNYLEQNIILDKASNFPTGPWYYFFTKSLTRIIPPISFIIVPAWLIFWIKRFKHPLTFGTLSLVTIHSIIANKAFRYLFPIAPLSPLVIIEMNRILPEKIIRKGLWFLKLCLGLNFLLLIYVMFSSARPVVGMYQYIYKNEITEIHYTEENPYTMVGLPLNFYRDPKLTMSEVVSYEELDRKAGWIFVGKGVNIVSYLNKSNCIMRYSSYPAIALNYNLFKWVEKSRFWALFWCE